MKAASRTVVGLMFLITLLLGTMIGMNMQHPAAYADGASTGSLMALTVRLSDSVEAICLINAAGGDDGNVMAIYTLGSSGNPKIKLCSTRKFEWDVMMPDYNGDGIKPRDIKRRYDEYQKRKEKEGKGRK